MRINLIGVPSCAGALYTGTELAPAHLRAAGLVAAMEQQGLDVDDLGDLSLPPELPRHNVAPVRNWPAPRMVWEQTVKEGADWFGQDRFALILGGDCSIVAGVGSLLGEGLHLLAVDAHVDAVVPGPAKCLGAAASGLWFLTRPNPFWLGPVLAPEQVTILAVQNPPEDSSGFGLVTLGQVRAAGMTATARAYLDGLPPDARVLIHFDVDALNQEEMPAAYAPSEQGLTGAECRELLAALLADPRVIGLEVTEFSGAKDPDGAAARRLVSLLAGALGEGLASRSR